MAAHKTDNKLPSSLNTMEESISRLYVMLNCGTETDIQNSALCTCGRCFEI